MHFCFINMPIEYYSPTCGGAIATIIMETAKELIALGHEVTVLTKVNDEPIYDVGTVVPIHAPEHEDLSTFDRLKCRVLRKLLSWDWPFFGPYKDSFTSKLKSLPKPPDATIVFNDLVSPKFIKAAVPSTATFVWLQNEQHTKHSDSASPCRIATDKYFACSEYIRQFSIKNLHMADEQIVTMLNGVNLSMFKRADGASDNGDTPLRTLFVGRIDPNKGPDIALSAVEAVAEKGLAVKYTVAGDVWFYAMPNDPRQKYKQQLVEKMDAQPFAEYMGHVAHSALPELFQQNDVVFVLSRSNDPCPLVVLEAMASGCAVIASGRGGLPEQCADAGIVIKDPDDVAAVADALERMCRDKAYLSEVKSRSYQHAQLGSWKNCALQLVKAVDSRAAASRA
jgi:glycosyltransferase involved in cell wall biosynthesis